MKPRPQTKQDMLKWYDMGGHSVLTRQQGDMRGTYYDVHNLSYLFDLNDLSEDDERE